MGRNLDRLLRDMIAPPQGMAVDFASPPGAAALFAPASLTWRVMKNPVALMVGGIAAVILELAEPRVRTGVWEHTSFRRDPVTRMRRTGYAAWTTVYAPAATARAMIAGVVRAHGRVEGRTPAGLAYRANDEELLNWVQATAGYGFFEAYRRFVRPMSDAEMDGVYGEGADAAALYGALGVPRSLRETEAYFEMMRPKLEASEIIDEFLTIVRAAPILPLKGVQRLMVRAAVEITPRWARDILGLGRDYGFRAGHETITRTLGALADRIVIESAPPAQSCKRLGLPVDYLYR
ncbi:oxygenase MpaB family protein [Terricaulis sp.]|uniref:oxygenase MpaB family protein n=1 Tax=Terricaulis sp. TaxID=2768686 RepID=UPI003783A793